MNLFLAALRPTGEPIGKTDLFGFIARLPRGIETESVVEGPFAAMGASGAGTLRPLVARYRHLIGAGDVRLDNRSELRKLARESTERTSDLELVLALVDAKGAQAVNELHGDFGFVIWDARAQKVIAARDPFGVKPLFLRRDPGMLLFSSRAAPLALREDYDLDYMRDFLFGGSQNTARTAWRDVTRVEAGQLLVQRGTVSETQKYWSAERFEPASAATEADAVSEFRSLFTSAIQTRLDPAGPTWAHLSGGLDSSSIVCTAERQVRRGSIGGTITLVDSLGSGDETPYSNLVVENLGLTNLQLKDTWAWQESAAFTATDEPNSLFPFQTRDHLIRDALRQNNARVLLSGLGADHYLTGNLNYIPDLITSGRWVQAASDLVSWSVAMRRSFWWTAKHYAIEPLVGSRVLRNRTDDDALRLPRWLGNAQMITREYARLFDGDHKPPRGRRFTHATARELATISDWVLRGEFEEGMEVRYPFLHRPLIEFALRLPVRMKARPQARKWVLREAMRDLIPEEIRTRQGKGGIGARILWSLNREADTIQSLLRQPLLAELGLIDVQHLRAAVDEARNGARHHLVMLMSALSLETWLAVRNGQTAGQRRAA
ncbi:MAG: asparagine synthase-related protein [Gemmatimonadota bacterium]